jgi:hypothetical protein
MVAYYLQPGESSVICLAVAGRINPDSLQESSVLGLVVLEPTLSVEKVYLSEGYFSLTLPS